MKKFNHPNIVLLLDVLDSMNNKYIITEYCNGPDLRDFLR
jgi:serine/threonine-protein kinase ULK/ATG1